MAHSYSNPIAPCVSGWDRSMMCCHGQLSPQHGDCAFTLITPSGFLVKGLAHMLHSLVCVSRQVRRGHLNTSGTGTRVALTAMACTACSPCCTVHLYPNLMIDLHIRIAIGLHQSFLWLHPTQAFVYSGICSLPSFGSQHAYVNIQLRPICRF